jgi:hypothetical protein
MAAMRKQLQTERCASSCTAMAVPLTHLVEQQDDALAGVQAAHVALHIRAAAAGRVTRVKHLHSSSSSNTTQSQERYTSSALSVLAAPVHRCLFSGDTHTGEHL